MRTTIRAAVLCCVAFLVPNALAVQWTGSTGDWSDTGNWAGGTLPGGFSSVEVDNGGTPLIGDGDSFVVGDMTIGSTAAAAGSLEVSGGELSPLSLKIGERGNGTAIVSGGSVFVDSSSLFIGGKDSSGTGELTVNGPTAYVQSLDDVQLGRVGTGTLNLSDGEMEGVFTVVGKFGSGVWNQSGGLYVAKADMEIGDGGKPSDSIAGAKEGTINLSGGILQASGFAIGNRAGTGTVNVSGTGQLAVTRSNGGTLWIGRGMDWGAGQGGATELRVAGGDAVIVANNEFVMNASTVASSSTLIAEITGSSHTTIKVGGNADLTNGTFRVELNGYTPASGDSWTILETGADFSAELAAIDASVAASGFTVLDHNTAGSGGTLAGTTFATEDLSAALPGGLSWELDYTANTVVLSVTGETTGGVNGDFNGDGSWDMLDIDALTNEIVAGTNGASFDMNGDGSVDLADVTSDATGWLSVAGAAELASGNAFLTGDQNLDGAVDSTDLGLLLNNFGTEGGVPYSGGDLNADASVDSTDLGLLLNNFGASASAAAVPEPQGMGLAMLMAAGLVVGMRRRK